MNADEKEHVREAQLTGMTWIVSQVGMAWSA